MYYIIFTLLILFNSSLNVLSKNTKPVSKTTTATKTTTTSPSSEKLFCSTCSYEYTFDQIKNQSNWESPWTRCENKSQSTSSFGATACHTLIRVDYARQYVTIYYNSSYLSAKKLPDDDRRIFIETALSTDGSRAQLKAFYECSFEDNCHLPLDPFLQLRTALVLAKYNYTKLMERLIKFYGKPKTKIDTYFHADTTTSTLNGFCGDVSQWEKLSLKTLQPKCTNKKSKQKSKSTNYEDELKATVYTCDGSENTYCNNDKKLKEFLNEILLKDYLESFF